MRCESYEGGEEISPRGGAAAVKSVVLIGSTGNGKSATGNTIIGRQVFKSLPGVRSVTSTCQIETTVFDNGQILNVIDTPGLFDSYVEQYDTVKEFEKCINMAKDGIHAFVLVLSLKYSSWEEEESAFKSLLEIFGEKIADYMIVVYADGDDLGKEIFDDLLAYRCLPLLESIVEVCGNRVVLFDYKTEDEVKISGQRKQLLSLVETVVERNGGKPYTNDLFDELKNRETKLINQSSEGKSSEGKFHALNEEQFDRSIEMVESRLKESILNLEKQLAEERASRMEADMKAHVLQTTSKNEVESMLKESIRTLEKQLDFEAARMEAEMKALSLQTESKGEALELKLCLNRAEESRKQLEERLHRVESIHTLEKQLAEERASRLEVETKSKGEALELKLCLNRAEESRKQLEERLHRVESIHTLEKQLAEEMASRLEVETKLKGEVLELKECLNRAEESRKQLEERLHRVEKQLAEESAARMKAEMKVLSFQTKEGGVCIEYC